MNIYAPPNAENAPVMFWLHGGGNTIGEAASYSGENLAMKHGVVVVTINYRLGLFGWFSHPSLSTGNPADDSGNYGTLDVVRGLKWVKNNIEGFGGNPGNVTLFGESAGAFDTLAMMASPLAEGLFHRAIVQSGGFESTPMSVARNTENATADTRSAQPKFCRNCWLPTVRSQTSHSPPSTLKTCPEPTCDSISTAKNLTIFMPCSMVLRSAWLICRPT